MPRYIDADARLRDLEKVVLPDSLTYTIALDIVTRLLNTAPTADVAPVVRCKDCKHQRKFFHKDKRMTGGGYWTYWCDGNEDQFVSHTVNGHDDDYCSYGERKETNKKEE